ncbi:monooxygenase [Georgenia subflava]|uniref:Monooxygenase n=1 Tax=Georgenia subflava TaxID=1622177 RepID=A0A6N7ELU6_9MICO|nr:monooxygenase [Georgenia subflava]MPV38043.1 monooxygenase [Georgenia subflava]
MTTTLLYVEFSSDGPFGSDAATAYAELAADIAAEEGLVWKVWTENPQDDKAGGVYLFADEESATRYVEKHTARLGSFGITDATMKLFTANRDLSETTFAVLDKP